MNKARKNWMWGSGIGRWHDWRAEQEIGLWSVNLGEGSLRRHCSPFLCLSSRVRQGQAPVEKGEGWPEFGQVELTLYFVQIDEWGQTVS